MENVNITSAQYIEWNGTNVSIQATMDGQEMSVPLDPANRHYAEIMRQVNEGTLKIQDADIPDPADKPDVVDPMEDALKRIAKLEAALAKRVGTK